MHLSVLTFDSFFWGDTWVMSNGFDRFGEVNLTGEEFDTLNKVMT